MNSKLIESIARTVLYEGYMLYPYRPSALKNRQRWNFGVLYPKAYSELQNGTDASSMQTQCLVRGTESTAIAIDVRFLQCVAREESGPIHGCSGPDGATDARVEAAGGLESDDRQTQSWREAAECAASFPAIRVSDLCRGPIGRTFSFAGGSETETVRGASGCIPVVRRRGELTCSVEASAIQRTHEIFELTVAVANTTPAEAREVTQRENALMKSLLSTHTILGVTGGEFLSLLDPPEDARDFAAACKNIGTWPVLVGDESESDAMLSSPIILYDYPRIAPESPGDLFDGTEIDEILSLRILTLSDGEKNEISRADDRAREILERTEALPPEHFRKLHGAIRNVTRTDRVSDGVDREDHR